MAPLRIRHQQLWWFPAPVAPTFANISVGPGSTVGEAARKRQCNDHLHGNSDGDHGLHGHRNIVHGGRHYGRGYSSVTNLDFRWKRVRNVDRHCNIERQEG